MTIGLEHVFDIIATIGPALDGGPGPNGHRRVIPITGGRVAGPRLQGEVVPGGADYEWVRPDGTSRVEAHYALRAADGTPIYIVNRGLFVAAQQVIARVDAGAPVDAADYYFRSAPVFDAPAGAHGWLSDNLFVADCRFTPAEVTISVHRVT
jgi:hypothetical protein